MALSLILEVSGEHARELGEMRRKVFGHAGGRIGRSPECDWVLSNRYVSRHHATVSCVEGVFHIESVGENGVAVNDQDAMLPQLVRRALVSGDRLFIDEYEISVSIGDVPQHAGDASGAAGAAAGPGATIGAAAAGGGAAAMLTQPPAPVGMLTRPPAAPPGSADSLLPSEADLEPLKRFLSGPVVAPTEPSQRPDWNHSSSLADHFNPPPVPTASVAIPKGWEGEVATAQAPVARFPGATGAPTNSGSFDGLAFLAGAGLEPDSVPSEMAATLGQIVRSVVQGLMDVLRARAEFRNQFRLPVTRVQMAQNNPLKFAVSAEDALTALLRTRARGYLPPREAFDDAFDDIRFHQLAMLAGMRAGFESMMSRFDPKKLQEQSDRRNRGFFARFGARQRYWDRYVDQYEQMAGNADSVFQRLYGEEFSGAYERQLEELKRARVKSTR
jgi:type VI secretion system protein ImpI